MTDDWEWVDAAVPDGDGGMLGILVGRGSCGASATALTTDTHPFRCCQ